MTYKCSVKNCMRANYGHGFCELHYYRFKTYGDPLKTIKRPYRSGSIVKDGIHKPFKLLFINGKRISEHRHIMEQHLKRKLLRTEVIHHFDGNSLNNNIKNLVLCKSNKEHMEKFNHFVSPCWQCSEKYTKNEKRWCKNHQNNYGRKCKKRHIYGKLAQKESFS